MSINKSQFVTPTQLAKMLGISRAAISQKIKKNEIKAENIGDPSKPTWLIPKSSLSLELQNRITEEQKSVTKKVLDKNQHHDLSFEKELWMAADKLRGNVDVSEYKNIVLGLLFLKYISDSFYKQREVLTLKTKDLKNEDFYVPTEEARKSILETKDFYTAEGVFYVPEKSRWEFLQTKTMSPDLGKVLDTAMELIEKDNPVQLENVLPRVYTKVNLDHTVLGELVNIFSQISFDHDFDREKDILGRIYEYFLGQFASSEGKRGGEFFTPRSIVKLLVEILQPYENARVADFACGSGGMFVSMGEYLRDHKMDPSKLAISGQESNQTTLRLCKMNLAIRGLSGKIELGNTYYQDRFPHLQADFVIANPPFNAEWEPSKLSDNDPRIFLGIPPSSNANFLWVQHFSHHLSPNGQAGFVMPNGALAVSGKEGELRQKLVEADMVDVIISCPSKLFYNVSLPVSLWFLAKNKGGDRFRKRKGETLFIDARDTFEQISRKQVIFNKEQIEKITNTVRAWRGELGVGKYEDIPGFCKSALTNDIAKKDYVLSPLQYVGSVSVKNDNISFHDDLENISVFLKKQTLENSELDRQISERLNSLYPDFDWTHINFSTKDVIEEFAQKIFNEWFLNFRFPRYENVRMINGETTNIPEGWKIGRITDVIERLPTPKTYKENLLAKEGDVPVYDQSFKGIIGYHDEEPSFVASIEKPFLIFGDHTCRTQLVVEPFSLGPNTIPLAEKNGYSPIFSYFLIKGSIEQREYKRHWNELLSIEFIIPPAGLVKEFIVTIECFIKKMVSLEKESAKLKKERNKLLTKLI